MSEIAKIFTSPDGFYSSADGVFLLRVLSGAFYSVAINAAFILPNGFTQWQLHLARWGAFHLLVISAILFS